MAGVHGLQHVQGFAAAHLPDDDPVRPHPQRRPDQVPDRYFSPSLRVGVAGLQRYEVRHGHDLQLGRILDRDHALVPRDKLGQSVQEGRFPRTRAAADKNVVLAGNQLLQKQRSFLAERPPPRQIVHRHRFFRKLPDRHGRTFERDRGQDDIDAGAVLQPGIDDRRRFIDDPVHAGHDRLNDVLQPRPGLEFQRQLRNLAVLLDKNVPVAVHHDFRDRRIIDERLQNIEPAERIEYAPDQLSFFRRGQILQLPAAEHRPLDELHQLVVVQSRRDVQAGADLRPQLPEKLFIHIPSPRFR